jgi:hypothetical protein
MPPVEVALDVQQAAESSIAHHASDLLQGGLVAPVESDRQHAVRVGAGSHGGSGRSRRQGERLLHEDVLAGAGGCHHLLGVLRVRRREHDGIDVRISERGSVIGEKAEAVDARERACLVERSRDGGREADAVALTLRALDEILAPAAEADDGRSDHSGFLPGSDRFFRNRLTS